MAEIILDAEKIKILKKKLKEENYKAIVEGTVKEEDYVNDSKEKYKALALTSSIGKKIYRAFTDEELLEVLRESAKLLNHSPSQKEILWIFKEYIKVRFKKWPYAMEQAGLSKSAGKGGVTYDALVEKQKERDMLLEQLRQVTKEMGHIPHPHKVPELRDALKEHFSSWGEALEFADIDTLSLAGYKVEKIDDLEEEYIELLKKVKNKAFLLHRAPMHTEIADDIKFPLLNRCGSWRNVLFQIGLEPVVRRRPFTKTYLDYRSVSNRMHHCNSLHNCYFKLINPPCDVKKALKELDIMIKTNDYIYNKEEVEPQMRKTLIEACASWPNVLFQLGIIQDENK